MSLETKQFQFGRFTLDAANSLLLDRQKPVSLAPKAFDTLVYLVKNTHRLVTREELMKAVWPDSFVEDANLTVNISLLRKALGEMEDGQPYIETVPRRGYRFNTEVKCLEEFVDASPPLLQPSATSIIPAEEPGLGSAESGGHRRDAVALHEIIAFPEPKKEQEPAEVAGSAQAAEQAHEEIRDLKHPWMLAGAICLVGVGLLAGWFLWHRSQRAPQFQQLRLTSFAPEMAVTAAAISTGAKFIAYANPAGLFIQVIETGETHALQLPEPGFKVLSISWFPDSADLLIDGSAPKDDTPSLWIVPVIGASPAVRLGPYPRGAVSPNGSEIALAEGTGVAPQIQVMRSDGSEWRTLVTGAEGETFGNASWSSDGRHILFVRYRWNPQYRMNSGAIDSYDLASGKTTTILTGSDFAGDVVSLRDGRVVYSKFAGANPSIYGGELFAVRTDPRTGTASSLPVLIAKWDSPVTGLSANSSGTNLTVRDFIVQHNAYLGDLEDGGTRLVNVRPFSFIAGHEDFPRAWTPDGRSLLLDSNRYGHWEIFKQELKSASDEPLIAGPGDQFAPWISPDGASMLYLSRPVNWREPQPVNLMRVPVAGGPPQFVLSASGYSDWGLRFQCPQRVGMPCVIAQRQGRQIVFRAFDPTKGFEHSPEDLGHVAYVAGSHFAWSVAPDGMALAWLQWSPEDRYIHVLPLAYKSGILDAQGAEREVAINGNSYLHSIIWSPDAKGWFITTQQPGSWTLLYATAQGKASTLLRIPSGYASDIFPSPDGRQLAFSEESIRSNVWLLRNF